MKHIETKIDDGIAKDFTKENAQSSVEKLYIFTCLDAKPRTDCGWFYRVIVEDNFSEPRLFDEAHGNVNYCDCFECKQLVREINEFVSIIKALDWAKLRFPSASIELWVSSEQFLNDFSESLFGRYHIYYRCFLLKGIGYLLNDLLSVMSVEAYSYTYANKDIIPYFV